ncbi:MAG TPA: hypothetical protein VJ781_08015 [Pyrinomonadaceae bacterium]|nr:hypothetical protein [Pyrinomonadaceae bacterium]
MADETNDNETEKMNVREITLSDGRYMVFYTFGDEDELIRAPTIKEQRKDV